MKKFKRVAFLVVDASVTLYPFAAGAVLMRDAMTGRWGLFWVMCSVSVVLALLMLVKNFKRDQYVLMMRDMSQTLDANTALMIQVSNRHIRLIAFLRALTEKSTVQKQHDKCR